MTRLYITRHGQTEWNVEGRLQGQKDSKLTELGESQAIWLGESLKDVEIDIIISSSSGRAMKTAELIRGNRDIEIMSNDNLREIHLGEWEGQLHLEIEKHSPDEQKNFWNFPHLYKIKDGETFQQVFDRVTNEIERVLLDFQGKNILVVTHAVVLKSLITYFENKEIKDLWSGKFMNSTCLNIVEIKNDSRKFVLQGDTSHYPTEEGLYSNNNC
ncbi:putative phosphoglycerate mutase [Natranaerovirga pectinivora]|uniref:Putative phosphoglycerate mutase n=1 Tax=Natranaerovirga pectinivora TaxID=682400 RepID=A0A4R3MR19_9FIRM|nr:histidine phosphatase family protein [Natranaerovirga pectinivora]TCT17224.1 putative phosphoglycerate mutase [Natranaerovirga pectinivora]